MITLKRTMEYKVNTETEAQALIQAVKERGAEEGYVVSQASYTYKEKKAKGEVIAEGYLVKVVEKFFDFWDDLVEEV